MYIVPYYAREVVTQPCGSIAPFKIGAATQRRRRRRRILPFRPLHRHNTALLAPAGAARCTLVIKNPQLRHCQCVYLLDFKCNNY